jgi:dipeptidase E
VGVSAGSMVMTPRIGADFVAWPSAPDDRTHGIGGPAYVLDDQSAIKVTSETSEVLSEGNWKLVLP